ncbi:MAG: site-specific integrase [Acidobacteriota bacterium]|nr:site-specific integrase [Acidobacteriota bacterium]
MHPVSLCVGVVARAGGIVPTSAKDPIKSAAELAAEQAAAVLTASSDGVSLGQLCDGLLTQIKERPREYKDQKNPPYRIGVIKEAFGLRPAASTKVSEISDWYRSLPGAAVTQNRYRAMFSAVYNYGVQRDLIQNNPVRATEPVPVDNGVIRYLLPSEEDRIRKVLQAAVDACGPRNERHKKRMIHRICEFDLALFSGMREGEQYDLVWDDVNYETREATARNTKNGTSRQVHLSKRVVKALRTVETMGLGRKRRSMDTPNPSAPDVVFGLRDNKNWWAETKRRAKVYHFRRHDLRHTFCSRLAQRGVSLKIIQELAGHKTIQMSARYAHLDKTSVLKGLAVLDQDDN